MKAIGLVAPFLLSTIALAQAPMDEVKIKTQHVAGSIYMLEGRGGNIGVSAGDDGLLMVDDQYAPLAAKIRVALEELKKGSGR